jgi:hypothetical protein
MANANIETLRLRVELADDPEAARKKIVAAYESEGSIELAAVRLGIPGRTLSRILSDDAKLRAAINRLRKTP